MFSWHTLQGFKLPSNAFYVHCSDECRAVANERISDPTWWMWPEHLVEMLQISLQNVHSRYPIGTMLVSVKTWYKKTTSIWTHSYSRKAAHQMPSLKLAKAIELLYFATWRPWKIEWHIDIGFCNYCIFSKFSKTCAQFPDDLCNCNNASGMEVCSSTER